jgi:hypothetical protein
VIKEQRILYSIFRELLNFDISHLVLLSATIKNNLTSSEQITLS